MKSRTALFRVDAAPAIGGGHVMRCLTLANALSAAGWSVTFAIAKGTDCVVPALARAGYPTVTLQDPSDPAELRQHLPQPVDLIVIDHYGLDARYESRLRGRAKQILVIDDLVDRPHDCDILLDQTFGRDAAAYKPLVPPGARILAGATYALLRPEFAAAREKSLDRRRNLGSVDRILISMGLTDLGGITAQVLNAVLDVCPGKAIDVVLGPSATSLPSVQAAAAAHPNVTVHIDPPTMPDLMAAADLAIGAAGTTTWERCCLGLPTITLVLAGNQADLCRKLGDAGALLVAATPGAVCDVLRDVLAGTNWMETVEVSAAVVDGHGASRIVKVIDFAKGNPTFKVRPAEEADVECLWKWRNDPVSRASFINSAVVQWRDHVRWFREKLGQPSTKILLAEVCGVPAGMVRFDFGSQNSAEVSINVDPAFRSQGVGQKTLDASCKKMLDGIPALRLFCRIKPTNPASITIFRKAGFKLSTETSDMIELERSVK